MTNVEALKEAIKESGMTVKAIAEKAGILRETLYNKMTGKTEFTASEITNLSEVLNLTTEQRDIIFLSR